MAAWVTLTYRLLLGSTPFVLPRIRRGLPREAHLSGARHPANLPPDRLRLRAVGAARELREMIQELAPYLPTYRYAELAWSAVGANTKPLLASALWIAGYGVAFLAAPIWAYRREDIRRFG